MLTKGQLDLLLAIKKNDNHITFKEQNIFKCQNWFYQSISVLKNKGFIISESHENKYFDKRIQVYFLTFKGIKLMELLGD